MNAKNIQTHPETDEAFRDRLLDSRNWPKHLATVINILTGADLDAFAMGYEIARRTVSTTKFTAEDAIVLADALRAAPIFNSFNSKISIQRIRARTIAALDQLAELLVRTDAKKDTLQPELVALYQAGGKGFHTSEACDPDNKYQFVSKFRHLADLHAFQGAWIKAMITVRDHHAESSISREVCDE